MSKFTRLEEAVLHAIFAETPEIAPLLEQQLGKATVKIRENTGGGFLTTITVPEDVPPVNSPKVLGHATFAHISGLAHGFGFVLFMKDGHLHMLDGHALGGESTVSLKLEELAFTVRNTPQ